MIGICFKGCDEAHLFLKRMEGEEGGGWLPLL